MNRTCDGWIFTRTRKFAPNGRLQIGQILAKPFQPDSALMPHGPLAVPEGVILDVTEDSNVSLSSSHSFSTMFRIWADLNPISVTADAGNYANHSDVLSWHFNSLKSKQISPPLEYVHNSLEHDEVPNYLRKWRWNKRVFMITGITIAEGAKVVRRDTQGNAIHALGLVDLSGTGYMRVGGGGEAASRASNLEAVGESSNFVFAYTVNEIFYRKITHKPFRKGEVQSIMEWSGGEAQGMVDGNMIETLVVDDVAEEPYQGDEDIDEVED